MREVGCAHGESLVRPCRTSNHSGGEDSSGGWPISPPFVKMALLGSILFLHSLVPAVCLCTWSRHRQRWQICDGMRATHCTVALKTTVAEKANSMSQGSRAKSLTSPGARKHLSAREPL